MPEQGLFHHCIQQSTFAGGKNRKLTHALHTIVFKCKDHPSSSQTANKGCWYDEDKVVAFPYIPSWCWYDPFCIPHMPSLRGRLQLYWLLSNQLNLEKIRYVFNYRSSTSITIKIMLVLSTLNEEVVDSLKRDSRLNRFFYGFCNKSWDLHLCQSQAI